MKDNENLKWTRKDMANQYKIENPKWTWSKCWKKANLVYGELRKLNDNMWNNNKVFFKMNTPFSFYDNRNDEFEEIFHDWNS